MKLVSQLVGALSLVVVVDRFYIALFSALEQNSCARMWFYTSIAFLQLGFWISTKVVHLQRWHGWCHMELLPSRRKFCVPHNNHAPSHFMQNHIRKVHACLPVTCHLHFWQNDRYLLRAIAVTLGYIRANFEKSEHTQQLMIIIQGMCPAPTFSSFKSSIESSSLQAAILTLCVCVCVCVRACVRARARSR